MIQWAHQRWVAQGRPIPQGRGWTETYITLRIALKLHGAFWLCWSGLNLILCACIFALTRGRWIPNCLSTCYPTNRLKAMKHEDEEEAPDAR